jgi:ATP adenylyltransferase
MDHLWTPWRFAYVTDADKKMRPGIPEELDSFPEDTGCVFCNIIGAADYALAHGMSQADADRAALIVHRAEHNYICLNRYPYNSGHIMIVPREHRSSLAALTPATAREMMDLARLAECALAGLYTPDGFNFGLNLGKAAGAGVAGHLHFHALPRWTGDTNFMTVVAETRVLPEDLATTWQRMVNAFASQTSNSADRNQTPQ